MPSKHGGDASGPVRRSPRAPARVKVKFGDQPVPEKRSRKRKFPNASNAEDNSVSEFPSPTRSEIVSSQEIPVRVVLSPSSSFLPKKKTNSNKKMDAYCWTCHKLGGEQTCGQCPRIFHYQCLGPKNRFTEDGICPECRLRSADGTELNDSVKQKLAVVLPQVLNRVSEKYASFESWKGSDADNRKLVCIMDLSVLQDRVNIEMPYKSTAAFLSDVKWILHNCHIIYGSHDPITNKAKVLINDFKSELVDVEACVQCYIRSHDPNDNFSNACKVQHTLVWAKMKGFPYWPAKVLKVIDSVANVRFFGSHDKARVPVNQCFLLSENSPNEKMPKKANFQAALDETQEHIQYFIEEHGDFHYAEPRTKFVPGNENKVTKLNSKVQKAKSSAPKTRSVKVSKLVPVSIPVLEPEVPLANSSDEVIDITDLEESGTEEHSSECNDVEIISEQQIPKKTFMDSLSLYRAEGGASSIAIVNVNSHAFTGDQQPTTSLTMNNVEMEFCEDENPETLSNPSHFLPGAAENLEDDLPMSLEETVKSVINQMISDIEGQQKYVYIHFQSDCHNDVPICTSVQPDIQIVGTTSRASTRNCQHRVINDYSGIMVNQEEHLLSGQEVENGTVPKAKFMHRVNAFVQEVLSEYVHNHSDCEKRYVELKEEMEKHKQRCDEIKTNTDLIIKNMRCGVETEKQKAVEEAKKLWETEMQQKIEDAQKNVIEETKANCNAELQKQISELEAQISSLKSKNEADIQAAIKKVKEQSRKENAVAMESAKKKLKKEMTAAITSTKRTQWCAYCLKEARFFCCWNTSYCDEECQRNHWMKHVNQCENISRNNESSIESTVLVTPQTDFSIGSKKSKNTSDNTNGQLLPTLRPNGQPVPRYINSGSNVTVSSIPLPAGRPTFITLPQDHPTFDVTPTHPFAYQVHIPVTACHDAIDSAYKTSGGVMSCKKPVTVHISDIATSSSLLNKNPLVITAVKAPEASPQVKKAILVTSSSPKPAETKTTKD